RLCHELQMGLRDLVRLQSAPKLGGRTHRDFLRHRRHYELLKKDVAVTVFGNTAAADPANEPALTLLAGSVGMRAVSNVPDVILLAARFGMRATSNVPDVILLAARFGMRASANVPDVSLLAAGAGTPEGGIAPSLMSRPSTVPPAPAVASAIASVSGGTSNVTVPVTVPPAFGSAAFATSLTAFTTASIPVASSPMIALRIVPHASALPPTVGRVQL